MLKPPTRLDGASVMRHLSVPRAQTQHWLELCRTKQWNSNTAGVTNLEDGTNAIPLNELAPREGDPIWDGHPHVDIPANVRPKSENWLDHLDDNLPVNFAKPNTPVTATLLARQVSLSCSMICCTVAASHMSPVTDSFITFI